MVALPGYEFLVRHGCAWHRLSEGDESNLELWKVPNWGPWEVLLVRGRLSAERSAEERRHNHCSPALISSKSPDGALIIRAIEMFTRFLS
jgi:hypothetical protein